jgi:hypothetical protein
MDWREGEQALFRHQAMHDKKKGDIVVTNLRIVFLPTGEPSETKSIVWANIEKVEYSPATNPATAMKITTVQGSQQILIQLTGGALDERLVTFQNMKGIVTKLSKQGASTSAPTAPAPMPPVAMPPPTARVMPPSVAAGVGSVVHHSSANPVHPLRQQLLAKSEAMQKLYNELVVGNIISEEDFWSTHSEALQTEEFKQTSTKRQGLANALWSDIIKETPEGKKIISLTPENKEIIFHIFTHVRIAFEKEVPLKISEKDFWKKFIEAEYHKGIPAGAKRNDNLFNKYISEAKDVVTNALEQAKKRQRFDQGVIVDPHVDLTTNFGDSKRKEDLDDEDVVKTHDDNAMGRKNLLFIKAFQESVALVKVETEVKKDRKAESISQNGQLRTDCEELEKRNPPTYIPMDLTSVGTAPKVGDAPSKDEAQVHYVNSGHKRKFDLNTLLKARHSGYLSMATDEQKQQMRLKEIENRANKLFTDEVSRLQHLDETVSIGINNKRRDELPSNLNAVRFLILIS